MPLNDRPFSLQYDGHGRIAGIIFDRPIPWPLWEGNDTISDGYSRADAIQAALEPVPEGERPEFKLATLINKVEEEQDMDDVRSALGGALIAIDALRGLCVPKIFSEEVIMTLERMEKHVKDAVAEVHTVQENLGDAVAFAKQK